MNLDHLMQTPRVELARIPSPLEPVDWRWGGHRLWVKRDDLTGAALSGNKVRKLEYLFADARAAGADMIVTSGGIQSNHSRATAIAARQVGWDCTLVLTGVEPEQLDGNLLLDRLVGADVRILPTMTLPEREAAAERVADELRAAGRRPYVIPGGGSNEIGALGYVRCVAEIAEDLKRSGCSVGTVVVPLGSGGTYVGALLGARLAGLDGPVIGATVYGTPEDWQPIIADYVARCVRRWKLEVEIGEDGIELLAAAGEGYAVSTNSELSFIAEFAGKTGLLLDPVYTGKAMYAFHRAVDSGEIRPGGDVIFIHTGGVFGLFPQREKLTEVLGNAQGPISERGEQSR